MSEAYEEIVEGERLLRHPPGKRHEVICSRLHRLMENCLGAVGSPRLLAPRSVVQISASTWLRPDLALLQAATGKLWLAAEIIHSEDHASDTVTKKMVYEDLNLPRLWMIDPRYDNIEIYHGGPYGLALRTILYGQEIVQDEHLPAFQLSVTELFAG